MRQSDNNKTPRKLFCYVFSSFIIVIPLMLFLMSLAPKNESFLLKTQLCFDDITGFHITDDNVDNLSIANKKDLEFLHTYCYHEQFDKNKMHELFLFPETAIVKLNVNNQKDIEFRLLPNGDLVLISSSLTPVVQQFAVFKSRNSLDTKKRHALICKYTGKK